MATFGKTTFSHASYASFRPSYPSRLYDTILGFHQGSRGLVVDLGTGHGLIARYFSKYFDKVIGTDPSPGMIKQAQSATSKEEFPNVEFKEASAESLPFAADQSIDMVVAGQAAHWFDYPRLFAELKRVMKPGGTLAFWGYKDHVFVDYPKASEMLQEFSYGMDKEQLGPYWQQPGRSIVQAHLRAIQPPRNEWDVERIEYEPGTSGKRTGKGTLFMERRMTIAMNMDYIRTWSSFHGWQEAHPDRKKRSVGGEGDCVDDVFAEMREVEDDWRNDSDWLERELDVEWGTGIVLARKK